jgi:2'-5' RNA ligase
MPTDEVTPAGVELHDWGDVDFKRESIFDGIRTAFEYQFPRSYGGVRAEVHNVHYEGPEHVDIKGQKEALLDNKFLHRKLRGTMKLFDEASGQQLDERDLTFMRVPFLTDRHTFIHNGSEYSVLNQARLLPGVYTRRKASGEFETHFNSKRGTGPSFRIRLEPESGLFKMDIGQSSLRLYSLLHDLGVPDDHLAKTWGDELLNKNRDAYDARVFEKAFARLVRRPPPDLTREQKVEAIKTSLTATKLNRKVMDRTLPNRFVDKSASPNNSVSATSQMKIQPKAVPPPSPTIGLHGFNQDMTQSSEEQDTFRRPDYLMLAQLLNQQFHAHIPMDLQEDQLVDAILKEMQALMPDMNKEMLAQLVSSHHKESATSLGCLMAVLTPNAAAKILSWSEAQIKPQDLTLDGIEQMPHVTCKYGFKAGFRADRLNKSLKDFGPVQFTLGKVDRFEGVHDKKADAIIVKVDSPDLVRLNRMIEDKFASDLDTSVKRQYKPHLTLAYVLPGARKSLDGHAIFFGDTYVLSKLMFKSAGSKTYTDIPLE